MDQHGVHGPALQQSMFAENQPTSETEVELFAEHAQHAFARA
jgi:hypothetical protein